MTSETEGDTEVEVDELVAPDGIGVSVDSAVDSVDSVLTISVVDVVKGIVGDSNGFIGGCGDESGDAGMYKKCEDGRDEKIGCVNTARAVFPEVGPDDGCALRRVAGEGTAADGWSCGADGAGEIGADGPDEDNEEDDDVA